jgi:hypothetical protein
MIIGYILLGVIAFGIIMGAIAGIMGLLYAKLWDKAFVPNFTEDIEYDEEDKILADWAKAFMEREDRRIGFTYVYHWNGKDKWTTEWYFQFRKLIRIKIFKYPSPKKTGLY